MDAVKTNELYVIKMYYLILFIDMLNSMTKRIKNT